MLSWEEAIMGAPGGLGGFCFQLLLDSLALYLALGIEEKLGFFVLAMKLWWWWGRMWRGRGEGCKCVWLLWSVQAWMDRGLYTIVLLQYRIQCTIFNEFNQLFFCLSCWLQRGRNAPLPCIMENFPILHVLFTHEDSKYLYEKHILDCLKIQNVHEIQI